MTQLAIIIVLIAIIAIYEFRKIRHKSPPDPKPIIEIHPNAQIETWGFDMEKTEKYTEDSGND